MITPEQTKALKLLLGNNYCTEVKALLTKRMVVNRKGEPHTGAAISYVLTGDRQNPDIEKALFDVAASRKKEINERDELLGIKKPEAETSGGA